MSIPGLPALNIDFPTVVGLLTQDAVSLIAGLLPIPWGIYAGALPVVIADTVVAFDFDQQFRIADFPIEDGQFASFNKTYLPFDVTLRFTAGGSLLRRQALLDSIQAIIGDTTLYSVVTADAVYQNVNLVGRRYRQTAEDGVGLMKVDVMARQVKTAPAPINISLIQNPLDPGASAQVNGGVVNGLVPTAGQKALLNITVHGGS